MNVVYLVIPHCVQENCFLSLEAPVQRVCGHVKKLHKISRPTQAQSFATPPKRGGDKLVQ